MSSAEAFEQWLEDGEGGSRYCYHVGFLANDRGRITYINSVPFWVPVPEIEEIGRSTWSAYQQGQVMLVQKRVDYLTWEYIAIKLKRRNRHGRTN